MKIWRDFWSLFDWIDHGFRMLILSIIDVFVPEKEYLTSEQEKIIAWTRNFYEAEGKLPTFLEVAKGVGITIEKFWQSFADMDDLFEKASLKK